MPPLRMRSNATAAFQGNPIISMIPQKPSPTGSELAIPAEASPDAGPPNNENTKNTKGTQPAEKPTDKETQAKINMTGGVEYSHENDSTGANGGKGEDAKGGAKEG